MRHTELSIALLTLTSLAASQTANVQLYGASCPDPLGAAAPTLAVQGLPQLGSSYAVVYAAGPSGRPVQGGSIVPILATGLSNTSAGGVPLPFAIPVSWFGQQPAGCSLLVSAEFAEAVPGATPVTFTVPNLPALAGLTLYHQWLVSWFDPFVQGGRRYVLGSNAARAVLGT